MFHFVGVGGRGVKLPGRWRSLCGRGGAVFYLKVATRQDLGLDAGAIEDY